jgi:hypothetical protein
MGSGAMIYIPSFIRIGLGVKKLPQRNTKTHRQHGDLIILLSFIFQDKESRLKYRWKGGLSSSSAEQRYSKMKDLVLV